jgi:uncharacterized membrane protein (UPF0127 family)
MHLTSSWAPWCLAWGLALPWVGCHATPASSSTTGGVPVLPSTANAGGSGAPPTGSAPKSFPARVIIHGKSGALVFDVELALDPESQERGLMFRKEVPPETGMLFVFPAESLHVFWMKNTLVPLDMLFLSRSRKIVAIIENAEPQTLSPRDPHLPAQYVLEIAGGTSFARGIKTGDAVEFEGVPSP